MDDRLYTQLSRLEDTHWWCVGRREVVRSVLARRGVGQATQGPTKILDVGCGTGGMLSMLREFGEVEGMDASDEALRYARLKLGQAVPLNKGQLPDGIPAGSQYNLITAFDVVEHIDDAVAALKSVREALAPGGHFVCTVPAFQFLWSAHDDLNHHKRRYDEPMLRQHLTDAGFEVDYLSYFNSLLFAPIAAIRLLRKVIPEKTQPESDLEEVSPVINRILQSVFTSERHLLARTRLPVGVSIVAVASVAS